MGIPNLTSFVKEHYQWKSVLVQRGRKIVIDGYSLCYTLYSQHHDWQLGGDYSEFYTTVSKYFQDLKKLEIVPYIVVDGIDYDNHKLSTTKSRLEQRLEVMAGRQSRNDSVLPLFAKSVFVDALRDLGLNFYVANGEADQDVVSLANHFGCPVLGYDSDYFIFNIEGGYIPNIDESDSVVDLGGQVKCFHYSDYFIFNIEGGYIPNIDESDSVVDLGGQVKCFHYSDFDIQFSLCNPDLRLYLPVFLGNDFRGGHSSSRLCIDSNMPINEMLFRIRGIEESNCDVGILKMKREVSLFYRIPSRSYDFLATSTFLRTKNSAIPQWVLDLYKHGKFMYALMYLLSVPIPKKYDYSVVAIPKSWRYSVVVEDISKPCAWEITRTMKRYIVGLLLCDQPSPLNLQVTIRDQCSLHDEVIPWSSKYDSVVDGTLADIPKLPESDRRDILLSIANCKKVKKNAQL